MLAVVEIVAALYGLAPDLGLTRNVMIVQARVILADRLRSRLALRPLVLVPLSALVRCHDPRPFRTHRTRSAIADGVTANHGLEALATDIDLERRGALRSFLLYQRSRLTPEDVGLPHLQRRRVPGLRRQEVAELIGVSEDWYRWFERGQ